uniref:Uncharacterized protein n=1 Tax=Haptolina brevifila TaxID=156173 RepID=A0A7S2DNZ8_9EUKA
MWMLFTGVTGVRGTQMSRRRFGQYGRNGRAGETRSSPIDATLQQNAERHRPNGQIWVSCSFGVNLHGTSGSARNTALVVRRPRALGHGPRPPPRRDYPTPRSAHRQRQLELQRG